MNPRDAANAGLTIYRDEMRDYINRTIQVNHPAKEGWLRAWAAGLPDNQRVRRERIEKALDRGRIPTTLFDVGDFQHLIAAYPDWFDESLRPGQHHFQRLSQIAVVRNQIAHDRGTIYREDAEEVLSWCIEVLNLAGKESAASAIRDIIKQMDPSQIQQNEPIPDMIREIIRQESAPQQGIVQEGSDSPHQLPVATAGQSNTSDLSVPDIISNTRGFSIRRTLRFQFLVPFAVLVTISILVVWFFTINEDATESQQEVVSAESVSPIHSADGDVLVSQLISAIQLPTPGSASSESVGVPIPPSGYGLARCGFDEVKIYFFRYDTEHWTKHILSLTWGQATSIWGLKGIRWGESIIDRMSDSQCEAWPTGRPISSVSDFINIGEQPTQGPSSASSEETSLASSEDSSPASPEETSGDTTNTGPIDPDTESAIDFTNGRIVVRVLSDTRLEFGWLPEETLVARSSDDGQFVPILPTYRFFTIDAETDRWLSSSGVWDNGRLIGYINARWTENMNGEKRIEFAFKPQNGELIFPANRFLTSTLIRSQIERSQIEPSNPRWLRSAPRSRVPIGTHDICIDLPIGQHILSVPLVRDAPADLRVTVEDNGELTAIIAPNGIDLASAFLTLWPIHNELLSVEDTPIPMFECPESGERIIRGMEMAQGMYPIAAHHFVRLSSNSSVIYVTGRTGINANEIYLHRLHATREDLVEAGCDLNKIVDFPSDSDWTTEYKLGLPIQAGEFSCEE